MLVRSLVVAAGAAALALVARAVPLAGQTAHPTPAAGVPRSARAADLDSLVARALVVSPALRTARARLTSARARVAPAGARPDPMLMLGVQNLPVTQPGFSDFMTMKMVGVSQTIPYPGKLGLQTAAAARESDAAAASLAAARLDVARQVRDAYYDIAYTDRALAITAQNQRVLLDLTQVTQAQYSVGTGAQTDVLRARLEATRLAQEANTLQEDRVSALARLNALLDQPSGTPLGAVAFPERIQRLAAPDSGVAVHFASAELGAPVAGSPLLPLDSLQRLAEQMSPALRSHTAMIAAQRERVALARKATLPDVSVSVQYGQRNGFRDMVTALVSVPLPLQHRRKQDEEVASATAELTALESEHQEQINALRADIAARYADVERARTQLAFSTAAILPQARATLASATASYQVGRVDFTSLIDAQAAVFNYETAYWRSLADFARALAELQRTVGAEVLK